MQPLVYNHMKLTHIVPPCDIITTTRTRPKTHTEKHTLLSLHHNHNQEEEEENPIKFTEKNSSSEMEVCRRMTGHGLNFKETELCLGLPGGGGGGGEIDPIKITGKRGFSETVDLKLNLQSNDSAGLDLKENNNSSKEKAMLPPKDLTKPPAKAQVVGWPPVRSFRKNIMAVQKSGDEDQSDKMTCNGAAAFVKVSMDGAPYLRKVDLKMYKTYQEFSDALAKMFSSFTMGNYGSQGMIDFMNESKLMDLLNSSEYVPSYEDKDGDWMLVGDVPWEMFVDSCKRLRIMKGSEAIGLAPRAMEKCKSRC